MHLRPLPAEEAAVRRYIEELWLPYNRDLAATVEAHALDDDVDILAEELEFRMDRLEADGYRAWVAVDAPADTGEGIDRPEDAGVADADGELAGFVTTELDEAPSVFDWFDRLVVCDIYVSAPYRGGDLAETLLGRATERAEEEGCEQVVLDVDIDNERALAFYEKHGFEPIRHRMAVATDEL